MKNIQIHPLVFVAALLAAFLAGAFVHDDIENRPLPLPAICEQIDCEVRK